VPPATPEPDLNPMAHVWMFMKDSVAPHRPESVADLRRWTPCEWDHLKIEDFCPTIFYMPDRLEAIIEAGSDVITTDWIVQRVCCARIWECPFWIGFGRA